MIRYYIAPILRYELILGLRFGYIELPNSKMVQVDDFVEGEGIKDKNLKSKFRYIFERVTPFEYSEDYLVILLSKDENYLRNNNKIDLKDVRELIPLDNQAKTSIEIKNENLKLVSPYFSNLCELIQEPYYKDEHFKGVEFIWKCLGLEGDYNQYIDKFGRDSLYKGLKHRMKGTKANELTGNDPSNHENMSEFWPIVMAYDRYSPYPDGYLGYFFDLGEVYSYYKGHNHFPELSGLYQELVKIGKEGNDLKIPYIADSLEGTNSDKVKNFNNELKRIANSEYDIKIVLPYFFWLRDLLRNDRGDFEGTILVRNLTKFKLSVGEYLPYISVLLGVFFGRQKFADMYHKVAKLPFLKYPDELQKNQEISNQVNKSEINVIPLSKHKKEFKKDFNPGERYNFPPEKKIKLEVKSGSAENLIIESGNKNMAKLDENNLLSVIKIIFERGGNKSLSKTALYKEVKRDWRGGNIESSDELLDYLNTKKDFGFIVNNKKSATTISYYPLEAK